VKITVSRSSEAIAGEATSNGAVASPKRSPFFVFKIAQGMTAATWFAMLARNDYAVSPGRMPFAIYLSGTSILNSALALMQHLIFGRRIAETDVGRPIFIVGHWRTGTTWLHELLALDPRFVAPSTLECFAPRYCLLVGWLARLLTVFLPKTRPMDEMPVGWDRPQEDELALLNMGIGSPYETMIFPNHRPIRSEYFHVGELAKEQRENWQVGFTQFCRQVMFRGRRERAESPGEKRLVLKSPPHTARIAFLRQLFPGAQFIHVVRHPYEVFASSVRLWCTLFDSQGCQKPEFGELANHGPSIEQFVLDEMDLLYRDFADNAVAGQFCQVRYEDMLRDPIAEMRRVYAELDLGTFEAVRPKLEAYILGQRNYKANIHHLSPPQKADVDRRWHWYFESYGYSPDGVGS